MAQTTYQLRVEIDGRDPFGLRDQCEAALPAEIEAADQDAADDAAGRLLRDWIGRHTWQEPGRCTTGADRLMVVAVDTDGRARPLTEGE